MFKVLDRKRKQLDILESPISPVITAELGGIGELTFSVPSTYTNTTVNRTVNGRSVPTMDTQAMAMARSAVMPIDNMSDIDYFLKKTARAKDRKY